ncbi:NfeD family protein [Gaiella sp.]|uniref:NfeD family protein n=1 Tax=Gaiella sp. TaxID=2663207 RepID=UPI0032675B11
MTAAVIWLVVALVLIGLEVATLAFVALYPALGGLLAGVAALLGASIGVQFAVFAVVSVATLLLTRKPLRRMMRNTPLVASNADIVLGKRAVVIVAVEEGPGQRGQVRVGTEHWSARSEDERPIAEGMTVEVVRIDGVALVVRPVG